VEHPIDSASERTDDAEPGPVRGVFQSLAKLMATAIGIAQTRLELLSTELQQEVHRAAEILVWTLVALLAALIGLFMLALVIIFIFWDTHRIVASLAVTGGLVLIALTAALILRAKVRSRPRLFDATLTELAKDRASLMHRRS
jgi:uncharacterized membrane protein YqjE